MFTKKLEDQFSADLLNTVRGVLGEAKKCSKNCKCEKCEAEDDDEAEEMKEGKTGLWANIHAKRKRIKAGSGERMRKPGSKGAPTDADFRAASEEVEIDEANLTGLPKSTAEKNKQYIEITHQLGHKRRVPVHPTNAYKALNRYRNDPMTKSARIVSEETKKDSDAPFEGPYRKAGERKDRYGNVVKNVAKHLAKKAMMAKEEVEQIDEVGNTPAGKRALGRYIKDRRGTILGAGMGMEQQNKDRSTTDKQRKDLGRKASNAFTGVARAVDRLTKEEADISESWLTNSVHAELKRMPKDAIKRTHDTYMTTAAGFKKNGHHALAAQAHAAAAEIRQKYLGEDVELEEGRGRPPKEGSAAWHAKQKQDNDDMPALGAQLRKAKSMNKKVRFMDGKEHEIHPNHADRFEDHMAARKTSQEKMAFQNQAHKSHADFVKAVTAPVPKSSKDTGEIVKYRH